MDAFEGRQLNLALGMIIFAGTCLADSLAPYKRQVQIPREAASIPFADEARERLSGLYKSSVKACAPNPGASYFIIVTDASPSNVLDTSKASNELALTKGQIVELGFDEKMIFTEVIQLKDERQAISPNIIVEFSCRRKPKE